MCFKFFNTIALDSLINSHRITGLSPKAAEQKENHDLVRANLEKNKYSKFNRRKPKFKIGKTKSNLIHCHD